MAEHDSCVDMLIVCGSPSYNTAMPLGVAIAKTEKAVFGPRHRSKLIETMSFGAGAMKFRKDKRCTAWICSDPDVAKEYEGRDEDFSAFLNEEATKICKCEASRAW